MKKSIISLAIAAGLIASMSAQAASDVKVKWFGFAQLTAEAGDGADLSAKRVDGSGNPDGGLVFGADRVRFGFKIKDGNVFGKLQADLNRKHENSAKTGTLPEIIKDIEAGYKFSNAASLKVGQFKTPLGMDFNTSGKKLDITKRGMEKGLVLERTAGIMLSGRKIANGFGYDLFFGNVSGRGAASATKNGALSGKDNTTVARVMYDMGKMMHVELGYGIEDNSSTAANADDYTVMDLGLRVKMAAMTIKAEYIDGQSVAGVKNQDETAWYGHFGYNLDKTTELLVRHYQADADAPGGGSTSLTNTYLGANFFLGSNRTNGRVQLNYVIAGGDTFTTTGTNYAGQAAKGYTDDTFLAQYQISF